MQDRNENSPGPVIAALDGGPEGSSIVLSASALAKGLGAPWECLTIVTGKPLAADAGVRLEKSQRLAAGSGALVSSRASSDAASGILGYARERGASAIVLGKGRRRPGGRALADRLIDQGGGIPVLAVGERRVGGWPRLARSGAKATTPFGRGVPQYLAALLVVGILTGLNLALAGYAGYWAAAIPYLAGISLMALVLDRAPVLFAALVSAAAWDFLFIPPRFTFYISRTEDLLMLGLYFLVAICSGWLTGRLGASERLLAVRERRMSRLSELASALAGARDWGLVVAASARALEAAFDAEATIILREGAGLLKAETEAGGEELDELSRDAARLCLDMAKPTGKFTEDFESTDWHFVPMEGPGGCLGVIGLRPGSDGAWSEDLESYLRTMARTVAIAAARVFPERGEGLAGRLSALGDAAAGIVALPRAERKGGLHGGK
jgi:two-component system sensor histidine kinase KdpD